MGMGIAANIRAFRIRAGKTPAEMALALGLNEAWYGDLEQRDGELASTLSLFQAMELSSALGVQLHEILGEDISTVESIPIMALPERINAYLHQEGLSRQEFEDAVDWELEAFMSAPIKVAAELPLAFLQSLAAALDLNWLSLVPDAEAG
jgi:transcriptional regulator with XRE-family HTH domain